MIAAVDLGTSKTATAIAEVSDVRGIYIHSISSVQTEGIVKGVVRDLKGVGVSVYNSFSQAAHTIGDVPDHVFLSISGASIESSNISASLKIGADSDEVTDEVLEQLMVLIEESKVKEGYELVGIVPQKYDLDDIKSIKRPIGMFGHKISMNAHRIIAQESHIRNLRRSVERTDLTIRGFVLAVLGSAYAVIKEEESKGGILVIDFGGGTTDIAIMIDGCIHFSTVIPVGGSHMDNDLCQGLGVGRDEAIRLKHNYGRLRIDMDEEVADEFIDIKRVGKRDYEKIPKNEIFRILEPRLEELIDLIDTALKSSGMMDLATGGAVLVGGCAGVRGFRVSLSKRLGISVRVGYPEGFNHLLEEYRQPAFATVLGMIRYASLLPVPEVESSGFQNFLEEGWQYLTRLPSLLTGRDDAQGKNE